MIYLNVKKITVKFFHLYPPQISIFSRENIWLYGPFDCDIFHTHSYLIGINRSSGENKLFELRHMCDTNLETNPHTIAIYTKNPCCLSTSTLLLENCLVFFFVCESDQEVEQIAIAFCCRSNTPIKMNKGENVHVDWIV